uniref:Calcineurin-like phosphoesterase domain-containing protein n=1 Tax=Hyaloperonospora arabidopsidis (strain Emoy2) TaxID=559515 RepID=M4BUF5_HYAAE
MAVNKRLVIIGVVVLCAVIGAIIGVIIATSSSSSSTSSGDSTSPSDSPTSDGSGGTTGSTPRKRSSNSTNSGTSNSTVSTVTSDPTKATYSLSVLAVGDWGMSLAGDSCCSRSDTFTNYDVVAEDVVASIMDTQAGAISVKPRCVLGHGDSLYWTGIDNANERDSRFATTFEGKFQGKNLAGIPFVNVMGNHDYGGASFICSDGEFKVKCKSADELVAALDDKFKWQQEYTSPNDDRWVLKDHFYVHSIEDEASGVSIDIFNVDSGDADVHAALQVCCQCYGYTEGDDKKCKSVSRGSEYCAGGDNDMYDACFAKFTEWSDDSRKQLAEKAAASKATWKIVNSHYSPSVHYDENGMKEWFDILEGSGIHLWMYGHTHGEKHDFSKLLGIHFIENGAGGGTQKESASALTTYAAEYIENMWTFSGAEYGFFSVLASEEWLKVEYHTADTSWAFGSSFGETTVGGVETKHCWYVPADGTEGEECPA